MDRSPGLESLCTIVAAIFLVLALGAFVMPVAIAPGWIFVLASLPLLIVGVVLRGQRTADRDETLALQSKLKLLESTIAEHDAAADAVFDALDVAIFACDLRSNILFANAKVRELFRFDDPVGKTLLSVTLSHELANLAGHAVRTGSQQKAELSFTYPEDRVAVASAWIGGRQSTQLFVSVYDISDLRRLERIRSDFVANVSHELRTPLSIIRAVAETIIDEHGAKDEVTEKYLAKIITEVDRLAMITQDLLVLSAAESNPVRMQICDVADIFHTAVRQLQPKAESKNLQLAYTGPDRLLIEANTSQIMQIAHNLIENSLNYTTEGSVTVSIRTEAQNAVIAVADTGIGIASEHQARIFERFYRIDKARSRATGGTGLGLSIVRNLVEAHGGTVTVDSHLNQGSTFEVRLPIGTPLRSAASDGIKDQA